MLTHSWVLDERGKFYSKSEIAKARAAGVKIDYVEPAVRMEKNGAEMLRLWTAAGDYQSDVVFSEAILDAALGVIPEDPQHLPLPAVQPLRLRSGARRPRR